MITYEVNVVCDRCRNAIVGGAPNELIHLAIESAQNYAKWAKLWHYNIDGKWLCPECQQKETNEIQTRK